MTITKLEWHQEPHHRPTGRIAVVRDCIDEDSGATYWASLPKGMTLSDVIDDYVNSAEYDRPCPCSVALYADMQSWEDGGASRLCGNVSWWARSTSDAAMRLITYDGRTQNLRAWAREIGIGWRTLQQRLATGWPLEQALSAGKGELYKGKPALAPLARKAGVSARAATYRRAAGYPMEKVLQPGLLPHPPQHPLTFNGQTKSVTEWANQLGISHTALSNRLSRGWPLERALSWRRKPKE